LYTTIVAVLAALAGALVVLAVRRPKPPPPAQLAAPPPEPAQRQQEQQMPSLHIDAPHEGSIAIAGRPVLFSARTEPANLAAGIRWSVETQPGAAPGLGPEFTHTFTATGIEQIVARLDHQGLTCDVVIYVFKTPSGGSTLADLLRSEPAPVTRNVETLRRYGSSAPGEPPS
jgi:hypothetical protein